MSTTTLPLITDAAAELRRIRATLGLTQTAFAPLLGLSRNYLSTLETGHTPVRPQVLTLARCLAAGTTPVPVPATPPPDPASKGLTLAQGSRCGWKSERCQPPWWKFHATLDRQRHLEGEACERHLWILYDRVVTRLRAHAMKPKTPRGRPKRVYRTGPGRPKKHG